MKPEMLCLVLILACSFSCQYEERPYLAYTLHWTCLSTEGCERAEQVMLIDRAAIIDTHTVCDFWSSQDDAFWVRADVLDSDSLPPDCYLMSGFALFQNELEPSLLCHTEEGFEVELLVPNSDSQTYSKWLVQGLYTGRIVDIPR